MVERCDFNSREEYQYAVQMENEAYREQLAKEEECAKEQMKHDTKIRAKAIEDAIGASAKAICIGCGYLDGHSCTYKGSNCGVSKPMLEAVVKALEKLKGE